MSEHDESPFEHYRLEAENSGWSAWEQGYKMDECIFAVGSFMYNAWVQGWVDAKQHADYMKRTKPIVE